MRSFLLPLFAFLALAGATGLLAVYLGFLGVSVAAAEVFIKRAGYYVKEYVYRIEESVIRTLAHFGVTGHRVAGSPGIYVRLDDPFSHARLQHPSPRPSPASGRGSEAPSKIK